MSTETIRLIRDGEKEGRGCGGGGRGRAYTYRYTVITRMTRSYFIQREGGGGGGVGERERVGGVRGRVGRGWGWGGGGEGSLPQEPGKQTLRGPAEVTPSDNNTPHRTAAQRKQFQNEQLPWPRCRPRAVLPRLCCSNTHRTHRQYRPAQRDNTARAAKFVFKICQPEHSST